MTLSQTNSASAAAIGQEQSYLEMLYRLLDEARDRTERALTQTLGTGGAGGTFQARVERDFTATEQSRRLAQLNAVEHGLCFGRIDSAPEASGGPGGIRVSSPPEPAEPNPPPIARGPCTSAGSACGTTSTSRGSSTGALPRPTPSTPPPPGTRTG